MRNNFMHLVDFDYGQANALVRTPLLFRTEVHPNRKGGVEVRRSFATNIWVQDPGGFALDASQRLWKCADTIEHFSSEADVLDILADGQNPLIWNCAANPQTMKRVKSSCEALACFIEAIILSRSAFDPEPATGYSPRL